MVYRVYNLPCIIQIKICAKYRDMLPRPRLVCQEPGLRPIGWSPGVPDKTSQGLGSMSRYFAQILICPIAYIFHFSKFVCGFGWELCRSATMQSALCHCPLYSEWGWSSDNKISQHALPRVQLEKTFFFKVLEKNIDFRHPLPFFRCLI